MGSARMKERSHSSKCQLVVVVVADIRSLRGLLETFDSRGGRSVTTTTRLEDVTVRLYSFLSGNTRAVRMPALSFTRSFICDGGVYS